MRKSFWDRRYEKDVVRETLWETLLEICYEKDVVRKTLWERRFEKKTFQERHSEKVIMRKTL